MMVGIQTPPFWQLQTLIVPLQVGPPKPAGQEQVNEVVPTFVH